MKKKLLYVVGALLVLALVVYVGLQFFLGSIVKTGINTFAPKLTGSRVTLEDAQISPLSGTGTLSGFSVGNPPGWTSEKSFYLGKIHVDLEPFSVMGDHIVVNEITIDHPEFVYETKVVASNIGDLLKNIENATGGRDDASTAKTKSGKPIRFEVKKFTMQNGTVTLGVGPAAMTLPMPPITLENIGTGQGGVTSGEFAFSVMRSVTSSVVSATTQAALKIGGTSGAATVEGVKKVGEGLKSIFGGSKK